MGSWTHAIVFGIFWGLFMFPLIAGKRSEHSLRKNLITTLIAGMAVGLIHSFGRRAFSIPIVFITVPSVLISFYLSW
jgi:hypothetical protein